MTSKDAHPETSALNTHALNVQSSTTSSYAPTAEERDAIAVLPKGSALLVVTNGELRGSRFLLNNEIDSNGHPKLIVAGRSPKADIFLSDVTVSRQHAIFTPREGTFSLTDNNSLNGTYVNGDRVDEAILRDGSDIHIGKFHFTYFLGAGQ